MKRNHFLCCLLIGLLLWTGIGGQLIYGEDGALDPNPGEEPAEQPPAVKQKYPESKNGRPHYNEKTLTHPIQDGMTEGKYFVKVVFEDIDGTLNFTGLESFRNCIVRPINGSGNIVDMEFIQDIANQSDVQAAISKYLFVKQSGQAALYIPVQPLRAQTTYQVMSPPFIVYDADAPQIGNDAVEWTFVTTSTPLVAEVSVGSIPHDYDDDEPIILYGDFFDGDTISVYFNDIEADYVEVVSERQIKVYLPEGRHALNPGIYDIIVQNDRDHQQILYGSLSVVESGDAVPNEDYRTKDEFVGGEVRSDIKVSEDTLMLASYYSNETHLLFHLDQWMGDEVWTRNIQYFGDENEVIGELETKSRWGDITLYEVGLAPNAQSNEVMIRLGRAEPVLAQSLRQKLRGKGIQSDFIQVSGENYITSGISVCIPLKSAGLENVRLLRYDEDTRSFYPQSFKINSIDNCVEAKNVPKGIFVVVEE
jgi:hypothetical protein